MRAKPITRRTVLSRRDAMTADARTAASEQIATSTEGLLTRVPQGSIVALYAPKGSEVETARLDAFARARGLPVAYPRVVDGERRLALHLATPDQLVVARFGLREPAATLPAVALADVAAFLVPGLAFDRAGHRIGWGRGYYDATLVAAPSALRIGLAFECQVLDRVAHDPHDMALHYIVTEVTIYRAPD
jgi:5-formyltetrahydrofolate cyclo-ligase